MLADASGTDSTPGAARPAAAKGPLLYHAQSGASVLGLQVNDGVRGERIRRFGQLLEALQEVTDARLSAATRGPRTSASV